METIREDFVAAVRVWKLQPSMEIAARVVETAKKLDEVILARRALFQSTVLLDCENVVQSKVDAFSQSTSVEGLQPTKFFIKALAQIQIQAKMWLQSFAVLAPHAKFPSASKFDDPLLLQKYDTLFRERVATSLELASIEKSLLPSMRSIDEKINSLGEDEEASRQGRNYHELEKLKQDKNELFGSLPLKQKKLLLSKQQIIRELDKELHALQHDLPNRLGVLNEAAREVLRELDAIHASLTTIASEIAEHPLRDSIAVRSSFTVLKETLLSKSEI